MESHRAVLVLAVCLGCFFLADAQSSCKTSFEQFPGSNYSTCVTLPNVEASLSWTWSNSTRIMSATYVNKPEKNGGWVAWGINRNDSAQMAISSCIACFPDAATGSPIVKQFLLQNTELSGVSLGGELNIVSNSCVIDSSTSPQTIYLQFELNLGRKAKLYQIYGGGPGVDSVNFVLQKHNPSTNFAGFVDVRNVTAQIITVASLRTKEKNTHGALNAVGWGIFIPVGAMMARYMKPFADPLWIHLHSTIQVSGYALGTAGYGYGLQLRSWSSTDRNTHMLLGTLIFALATMQILVVIMKPEKKSGVRIFWNLYHWTGGYSVIVLAIVNNLIGFHILQNYGSLRTIYIVVIACLGGLALVLEAVTWVKWFNRQPEEEEEQFKVKGTSLESGGAADTAEQ